MKKNEAVNVFIPVSPSHIVNFELLINTMSGCGVKNILLNPAGFKHQESSWDMIIVDDIKLTYNETNLYNKVKYQLYKLKEYKRYIKKVKSVLESFSYFTFYYCNLEDILTNYFFFKFRPEAVKNRILVEDGVLNYYSYTVQENRKKQFRFKHILGLIYNLPFTVFNGNVTGIDFEYVKKQYVRTTGLAIHSEKAVQLPYPKIVFEPNYNVVLFIGQDILVNIIGMAAYLRRVDYYFNMIKDQWQGKTLKFIYKPHRNGDYRLVESIGKKYFGESFSYYLDNIPVEEAVEIVRPSKIFTFSSTGVLNIKLALIETVDVSFYAYPFRSNPELISLFEKFNIEIIE